MERRCQTEATEARDSLIAMRKCMCKLQQLSHSRPRRLTVSRFLEKAMHKVWFLPWFRRLDQYLAPTVVRCLEYKSRAIQYCTNILLSSRSKLLIHRPEKENRLRFRSNLAFLVILSSWRGYHGFHIQQGYLCNYAFRHTWNSSIYVS